jgi:histone H1/5
MSAIKKVIVAEKKKKTSHPTYISMITEAIQQLADPSGSSKLAIVKYIVANYKIEPKNANQHVKLALKSGLKSSTLVNSKGTGVTGSFKMAQNGNVTKKVIKITKPTKVVKIIITKLDDAQAVPKVVKSLKKVADKPKKVSTSTKPVRASTRSKKV